VRGATLSLGRAGSTAARRSFSDVLVIGFMIAYWRELIY